VLIWVLSVGLLLACVIITVVGTRQALRNGGQDRSNDNVMTSGMRLAGAAFVFLAAFAGYSEWQTVAAQEVSIRAEFAAVADLYRIAPAGSEGDALRSALLEYTAEVKARPLDSQAGISALTIIEAAAERPQGTMASSEMVDTTVKLADARENRDLLPDSGVSWVVQIAVLILGLITLLLASLYPSGTSRRLKWVQSLSSVAVVGTILMTLILLASPAVQESRLQSAVVLLMGDQMTEAG